MGIITPTTDEQTQTVDQSFSSRNLANTPPAKISPQQADEIHLDKLPQANDFVNASIGLMRLNADTSANISLNKWESSDYLSGLDRFTTKKIESGNPIMAVVKKNILERKSELIAKKYGVSREAVQEKMEIGSVEDMIVRINLAGRGTKTLKENRMRYVVIEPPEKPDKQISCPIIKIGDTDYVVDQDGFLYKVYNPTTGGSVYDDEGTVRMDLTPARELVLNKSKKGSLPKIESQTGQIDFLTQHGLVEGLDGSKAIMPEFLQFNPDKEIKGIMGRKVDRPDETRVSKEFPIQPVTKGFNNRIVSIGPGAIDGMGGFRGLLRRLAPPPQAASV